MDASNFLHHSKYPTKLATPDLIVQKLKKIRHKISLENCVENIPLHCQLIPLSTNQRKPNCISYNQPASRQPLPNEVFYLTKKLTRTILHCCKSIHLHPHVRTPVSVHKNVHQAAHPQQSVRQAFHQTAYVPLQ